MGAPPVEGDGQMMAPPPPPARGGGRGRGRGGFRGYPAPPTAAGGFRGAPRGGGLRGRGRGRGGPGRGRGGRGGKGERVTRYVFLFVVASFGVTLSSERVYSAVRSLFRLFGFLVRSFVRSSVRPFICSFVRDAAC